MKIDLSVAVTKDILDTMSNLDGAGQIPPVAKFGHMGTHFDVMNKEFHLDNTERNGKIFDVSHIRNRDIEVTDMDVDTIKANDFVLFHTGYLKEKKYSTAAYFAGHPELSDALITYLVHKKVSMIGIDAAGIRKAAEHPKADMYCADHGIFVVENLDNLDIVLKEAATRRSFVIHTYPVHYKGLTGLPCRVVAEFDGN